MKLLTIKETLELCFSNPEYEIYGVLPGMANGAISHPGEIDSRDIFGNKNIFLAWKPYPENENIPDSDLGFELSEDCKILLKQRELEILSSEEMKNLYIEDKVDSVFMLKLEQHDYSSCPYTDRCIYADERQCEEACEYWKKHVRVVFDYNNLTAKDVRDSLTSQRYLFIKYPEISDER